tara:strand:- start:124 stop:1101 length:978 start_codon:yes stop_codon:yes gene_type:complete
MSENQFDVPTWMDSIPEYEQNVADHDAYRFARPQPWEMDYDIPGAMRRAGPWETPHQPRTIKQITEDQAAYVAELRRLNEEILKVRRGEQSDLITRTQVRPNEERLVFNDEFMENLIKSRRKFNPVSHNRFIQKQLPALGMDGLLDRPLGWGPGAPWVARQRGFGPNTTLLESITEGKHWWKKPGEDPNFPEGRFYPEITDPIDPSHPNFSQLEETREWQSPDPPDWHINQVDRYGNHPTIWGVSQATALEAMNNSDATAEQLQKINEQRIADGEQPIFPPGMNAQQSAEFIEWAGQNWFGPTWGPEGSGNIWLEAAGGGGAGAG